MSGRVIRGAILGLTISLNAAVAAHAGAGRCWIDNGALVVSASFGDLAGDFIVDTAAPYSQLNETEAQAGGYDGDSATAPLRVSGLRLARVRLSVVSLDGLPQTDTAILGVIGQDVLSDYALTVRFSPCRFSLTSSSTLARGRVVKLSPLAGLPAIAAEYGDGAESRREPMLVSTGRWASLIPRARLSRTPAEGAHPPVRIRSIEVGGERFAVPPAALAEARTGTLGMSVWSRWRGMVLTRDRLILER